MGTGKESVEDFTALSKRHPCQIQIWRSRGENAGRSYLHHFGSLFKNKRHRFHTRSMFGKNISREHCFDVIPKNGNDLVTELEISALCEYNVIQVAQRRNWLF